ncbi:hypothetical protein H5410_024266 [Solanum commersonii]|uniref:Reverse transcriptase zinc-binding domain-containing protein n=1 Tax=Solanum commersonii TaxID=4109 RepID=A0A9J5ZLG3_SOLCO|nr:hypothetical protein H5410_024266 [Solanum commersonii]
MEPFQDLKELDHYKRKLGIKNVYCNVSAKNWVFWDDGWRGEVVSDSIKQISLKLSKNNVEMICTAVYARCDALERLELWEELEALSANINISWMVGGDFNIILNEEEKLGGLDFTQFEALDFNSISKRLDRVFGNHEFNNMLPTSEVHHLVRQSSDHAPLHVICNSEEEIIEDNWRIDFVGYPFIEFQEKMKKVKAALAKWSKVTFGNIFQNVATLENEVKVKEIQLESNTNEENRDGDKNTRFFHNYVKGRRKNCTWRKFKQNKFREGGTSEDENLLRLIPKLITPSQNEEMVYMPTKEEVKMVVFALNGDSTSSPDGFSGLFFQCCWELIGEDITKMVKAFFCGKQIPSFISHTNLVLLLKKKRVVNFTDLRPEIIRDINRRKKYHNVVVKLDMTKAYDRMAQTRRSFISNIVHNSCRSFNQGINNLNEDVDFRGYGMPKWSPPINHLSYADDTILFCSGEGKSVRKMMGVLRIYENIFGQMNKWLSYGGKYILISNVLQSMPIYLLSAMNPPKRVIEKLHKLFASFFWSKTYGEQGKYWVAWEDMCFPRAKGGVGFRFIHNVTKALFCKLWWNFRTSTSLWSSFMWSKYCKKFHPLMKKMIHVRDEIEHDIWWQLKTEEEKGEIDDEIEVWELIEQGSWNIQRLRSMLSKEMVQFIVESCPYNYRSKIRCNRIPFKISFFVWRCWKGRIAIDDNLKKMKINVGGLKCNTDGASRGNSRESAYSFCVRNQAGNLMYAKACKIGIKTNMEAETAEEMEEIQEIIENIQTVITHVFREANQLVDKLVNEVYTHTGLKQWENFQQLSGECKSILKADKSVYRKCYEQEMRATKSDWELRIWSSEDDHGRRI